MSDINSTLKFKNYVVENIEFNTNFDYSPSSNKDIDFDLDSSCTFEGDKFILNLKLVVFPEAKENNYPFTMLVKVVGLFEIASIEDEKTKKDFAEKNAVAILFPYLRALVSTFTANANIGALILPPINVVKYLEKKRNNEK